MNTNDLYLEYARVIKMCEGTELEDTPWVCMKFDSKKITGHPALNWNPDLYNFAVAVLEGKPVFAGDVIYDKLDKSARKIVVCGSNEYGLIISNSVMEWSSWRENASWTPPAPKRTFTLNGAKLPCPVSSKNDFTQTGFHVDNLPFCFDQFEDAIKVKGALVNLLTEARDKP